MGDSIDHEVTRGQRWRWAVWMTDDEDGSGTGDPLPLTGPATMDIRVGEDVTTVLVARLDTDPSAGQGTIAEDGIERAGLTFDLLTDTLPVGRHYYDLWATVDGYTDPDPIASGRFIINERVTEVIHTDA